MDFAGRVLLEDEHCLAIVKPAGQFTQGTWAPPGEQTLEQQVRAHLDPVNPAGVYLGIVHRLDRPVSGVLIWAKNPKAARRLSSQFEHRKVQKEYWAVVSPPAGGSQAELSWPSEGSGTVEETWTDWLTGAGTAGVVRAVPERSLGARPAVTRMSCARASRLPEGCRWLRLWPETGRTHQLRVQAAIRGLPVLGDAVYGSDRTFPQGIALHARSLRVRHPVLQTPLEVCAPLPPAWAEQGIDLASR
ncbi:MAG: RluA family pseudouridine synthase [Isosphaeraceae bacterium]